MWLRRWASLGPFALLIIATSAHAQQAEIGGLSDVDFGWWRGSGDLAAEVRHCVRIGGNPNNTFTLDVAGTAAGSTFALSNGLGVLPIRLSYNDGSGWRDINGPGHVLTGLRGLHNRAELNRCLNGEGQGEELRVRILESDLSEAPSGHYAGTLVLTVTPE